MEPIYALTLFGLASSWDSGWRTSMQCHMIQGFSMGLAIDTYLNRLASLHVYFCRAHLNGIVFFIRAIV